MMTFLFSLLAISIEARSDCRALQKYISLSNVAPYTYYMRVDPKGKYILLSGQEAFIIDLTHPEKPRIIKTSMSREAYPVERKRSWKWIAAPENGKSMNYFDFADLLKKGPESKPVFVDKELNQFYHSSAELPEIDSDHNSKSMHFRTSIWTRLQYRDYTVTFGKGIKPTKVEFTDTKELCPNLRDVEFSQPILSKDGMEVAGLTKNRNGKQTTKVFKIMADNTCALDYDVGFNTGKVSFNYPKPGKKPMITFIGTFVKNPKATKPSEMVRAGVWVYDPNVGKSYPITLPKESFNASFPGFTEDDRVFFIQQKGEKEYGVTIVDVPSFIAQGCVEP